MKSILKVVVSLLGLAALTFTSIIAYAHPEHDLVQASYLTLTEDEILLDIDFRPGYEVSEQVLASIDVDSDGIISEEEATDYTDQVIAALRLEFDAQPMELTRLGAVFPSASMLKDGLGIIQFHFSASLPEATPGEHELFYENGFAPEDVENNYLVNGFVKTSVQEIIDITDQERTWNQQSITLSYTISSEVQYFVLDGQIW